MILRRRSEGFAFFHGRELGQFVGGEAARPGGEDRRLVVHDACVPVETAVVQENGHAGEPREVVDVVLGRKVGIVQLRGASRKRSLC